MSKLKKRSVYLRIATVEVINSWEVKVVRGDSNSDFIGYKLTGPCFELQPNQSCNIKCTPTGARSRPKFCEVTIHLNMSPANEAMNDKANTNDVIEISHDQAFLIKKSRFDIGLVETETSNHSQFHPHVTVEHPVNNSGGQNATVVTNCSARKVQLCFFNPELVEKKNIELPPTKEALKDDMLTSTMQQSILEESFVAQESDREFPNLCGLENLGNTCYMNSALQCLLHTKPLRKLFLFNTTHKKGSLCYHYELLTKDMWYGATQVVNPKRFKDAFADITSKFRDSTQEDAQEFIFYLLSELHDELKIAKGDNMVSKPKPMEPAENWWTACTKAENSKIFDIFYCQIQTEVVTCRNRHKYTQFRADSQLTLPLPNFSAANQKRKRSSIAHHVSRDGYTHSLQKQKKTEEKQHPSGLYYAEMDDSQLQQYCTVEECLQAFTTTEKISTSYDCHDCKRTVYGGNVTTKIRKLGNVVIMHLNRFQKTSSGWTKSNAKIYFNDDLSIIFDPEHPKYDLYAVIIHEGSTLTSGHYYAIIKHEDNWFCMDDSSIYVIPKSDLIDMMSNAYVLFYQQNYNYIGTKYYN